MLTKTTAAVVATILLGSVSGAFADTQFDESLYHPNIYKNEVSQGALGAYAQQRGQAIAPRTVKPFTIEEQLLFDRASQRS
jgi:hypothetical protein